MVLSVRLNAISTIIASTCFVCLEDLFKNSFMFAYQRKMKSSENKQSAFQSFREKYQKSKSAFKEVRDKGNGSIYKGIKEMYKQYSTNDQQSSNLDSIMKEQLIEDKNLLKKIKAEGEGSYLQGLKKMHKEYQQQKASKTPNQSNETQQLENKKGESLTDRMLQSKQNFVAKVKEQSSQARPQKLLKNHLFFGALAVCGCIVMPRVYVLLDLAYFTTYQVYLFSDLINEQKKYPFLQNMKFQSIWKGYMACGVTFFGIRIAKMLKSLS